MDGGPAQTAPQSFNLSQGAHTIAVAQTQSGPVGTQYVFTSWSDGNTDNPRNITVGSSPATFTATLQTQYQLTIAASPAAGFFVLTFSAPAADPVAKLRAASAPYRSRVLAFTDQNSGCL